MKILAFFLCLMCAVSRVLASGPADGERSWRRLPDLPEALSGRFVGVSKGVVIVAGGSAFPISPYDGGKKVFSDHIDVLQRMDGAAIWHDGFRLERPLAQGAAVTTEDGILCIGGGDADRNYASVLRLRWNGTRIESDRLPDLPSPCAFSGAARIGSVVYVAGGIASPTSTDALRTFWSIDLAQKSPFWKTLPPWPGPGRIGAAVVAQRGSIYVISGASMHPDTDGKPTRTYLQDAYRYTPKTGWKQIADTPGPVVAAPVIACADGNIEIFGGDSGADAPRAAELKEHHPGFRRDILLYSTAGDRWTAEPNALPLGLVTTNAVEWGEWVVFAGGEDRPGHRSTEALAMRRGAKQERERMSTTVPMQMPLFAAGEGGYHTFRIPSLLPTKAGSLLAFAEGRRDGGGDTGAIDLMLKRSTDGGRTWGPLQKVWADGANTCGNPCPVVDATTGAICLLATHNNGQDHEKEIEAGTSAGTRTVWLLRSVDDGVSWSAPQEITATTKKPDWGWYATGPGVGIQMQHGPHKGRLIVPCNHSELATKQSRSHVIYSDDGGRTWKLGGGSPQDHTNESEMAEIADGRLVLNMRSADAARKLRSVCFSDDGGESWTDFRYDEALIEPICQGSLIADPAGSDTLLFANPASQTARKNLTVRLSRDGGRTWPLSRTLYAGPSAYSSLAALPNTGGIGCLYERGDVKPYEAIYFATFTMAALSADSPTTTVAVNVAESVPPAETAVFTAGADGYKSYRIPSLLRTKRGTLLAFCEGRKNSGRDSGDIDLLLRRSMDGGKTWGTIQTVWDDGANTCGNPCPVVDERTGDVLLLMTHNRGDDHQDTISAGTSKETRTVWIARSEDDGATWSSPKDITASVKRADWRWYATGPGVSIQKQMEPHKGRIIVPCDHSEAAGGGWSHVIYSDDSGATWKIGGVAPHDHTDECQVAELGDGRLLLNMRAGTANEPSRAVCISDDGGETWKDFHHDPTLIESRCEGSLISFKNDGRWCLVFSNPADSHPKGRTHLTIRLSHDNGQNWYASYVVHAGYSAYSCLSASPNGAEISCLYERGDAKPYETITFAHFSGAGLEMTVPMTLQAR